MHLSPIIEVEELLKICKDPELMIFDVSNAKNAKSNFETEHLEGAFFVELNTQLADIKNDLSAGGRHPLPKTEHFARTLTELGISKNKHLVLYDDKNGSNASARLWWMLRSAGHTKVQVLNGGLQQAKKMGFPLSSSPSLPAQATEPYTIDHWHLPVIEMNEVEKVAENPDYLVIDVRDKDRYEGKSEPIDLIAGHIPGAKNVPFTDNLDGKGLFLKPDALRKKYSLIFGDIQPENIIVHCGSGVTACHTLLALDYANMKVPKLYVGSWSEWSRNNKQIAITKA